MFTVDLYPHEFWLKVSKYHESHPSQRYGQAVFNTLARYKPDHAAEIRGTDLDPFYQDDAVPALSEWLARHWLDKF
jgi:hypothetical protein